LPGKSEKDYLIFAIMGDFVSYGVYDKIWEPETTRTIKEQVKEGDVVLDIGASMGYFTTLLARQVGEKGKVLAFEPTINQFPYVQENVHINGYSDRVKLFNIAAWDKNEKIGMPIIDKNFISQGRPIDDILEEEGIKKVDFIKIDVDGSEPQVLRGLIRTFENNKNLKMVFEWCPSLIKQGGGNPEEVLLIINKYFNHIVISGDYRGKDHQNWFCTKI